MNVFGPTRRLYPLVGCAIVGSGVVPQGFPLAIG